MTTAPRRVIDDFRVSRTETSPPFHWHTFSGWARLVWTYASRPIRFLKAPPPPARAVCLLLACVPWVGDQGRADATERVYTVTAYDVVLAEGGVLLGRIGDTALNRNGRKTKVVLTGQDRLGSVASTDAEGRFAFRGLRPGLYQLATQDGRATCLCRAWRPEAAPPLASPTLHWNPRSVTARGQIPMPFTNLRNTFAIGGVVGGAIAAPIIYNNAKMQNRVPASP